MEEEGLEKGKRVTVNVTGGAEGRQRVEKMTEMQEGLEERGRIEARKIWKRDRSDVGYNWRN